MFLVAHRARVSGAVCVGLAPLRGFQCKNLAVGQHHTAANGASPRRRREVAQAAQAQSERRAKVAEEVHWKVRAAMAAVALGVRVGGGGDRVGGGESGEGGRRQMHRCD